MMIKNFDNVIFLSELNKKKREYRQIDKINKILVI